jgi:cysteine-rich repeat protein
LGGGSSTVFSVTAHLPVGQVTMRNIVPQITFSKMLDATTVTSDAIVFTYADSDLVIPGTLSVSGNRVSFTPATPCPEPNADRFCFDANTAVEVSVSSSVKSSTGTLLSCTNTLCASSFITGELIDTEDPTAEVTLPDDNTGVPSDSWVDAQVLATDDAQVSVADFAISDIIFDSVPASGDDLTNVLIDTLWDTTGLLNGSSYLMTVTVTDIAGNTDEDSVTVDMRPATCFNDAIDGLETGLNCGGDSTSADYCGACDGSSCTTSADCGSGSCVEGVCVSLPEITSVLPPDGAPGSLVTLTGTGFGNFTGSVTFSGVTAPVLAQLAPACGDAWTNTQIIVEVPEGAIDGPLSVTTSSGLGDETFDDHGSLIADFDVNEVVHPGLCSMNPDSGVSNDAVSVSGQGLGASRDESTIIFGTTEAGSYNSWTDTVTGVTVPSLPDGDYAVTAVVDGVVSNPVNFTVASEVEEVPSLVLAEPASGSTGQYVTLSGTAFGSSTGTVWFENAATGERALADVEFPEACIDNLWDDQEILIKVPEVFQDGTTDVGLGNYTLHVVTNAGVESNRLDFTVNEEPPTPGLCNISPASALAGETVTLHGDNFGDFEGAVTFTSALNGGLGDWSDDLVTVTVPAGAVTGPVILDAADGVGSNPVNFEVGDSGGVAVAGQTAAYAWSFSSGNIPSTPKAIFACTSTQVSGVPNDDFTADGVCVNANVFVEFTEPMNESSLLAGARLEECVGSGNNPCSQLAAVAGTATTTSTSYRFEPTADLKVSTQYKVTLTTQVLSADGAPLEDEIDWDFTTRPDTTPCKIETVLVSPDEATIRELNGTQDFASLPVAGCVVVKDVTYGWNWSTNQSYAHFIDTASEIGYDPTCTAGNSTCALVGALAEGETPVTAIETKSGIRGDGLLTISFTDPYITNYWPNCTEACINAEVGASFSTAMSVASVEAGGAIQLYACSNELCTSLTPIVGAQAQCIYDATNNCTGFIFPGLDLAVSQFYRVIVAGELVSTSGVPLIRTNYGGDYSWTFRVRDDATACAVDRISVSPAMSLVDQIGDAQTFTGEAYGGADACSVSGQRLDGYAYNWSWTDPIANQDDSDFDDNEDTRVAEWFEQGAVNTSVAAVAPGCSASCVAGGSEAYVAICGDGTIGYGEECEDGNVANNDGCSATCLYEGDAQACGNGVVEPAAGEDCDDGNANDGDGCSAICLAEGSGSIGATCGNADVAFDAVTFAGEECDDGNAIRGDGCSNECLWEGSPTLSEVGGAICGNGSVETPAEECDDNNFTDGDGCSSSCLWEGSASTCGDGTVDYGEACDDANTLNGDGCSAVCLREGASTLYAAPSFCGDGVTGTGELAACEAGVGDANIDPVQVAFVSEGAVYEIDPDTNQAVATIEVTEADSGLTTEASLALLCAAENDTQCVDSGNYGVGLGGCCLERPTVTLFPNGENVCRNAVLYGIFTQEMDTEDFAMYAKLDLASTADGLCPADHATLAYQPGNLLTRVWKTIVEFVTGRHAQADTGDCVAPIRSFEQQALGDGTYKVVMHLSALLAANGSYTLVVEGDNDPFDALSEGVATALGVGMNGTAEQPFIVGSEVCTLDAVNVIDTDSVSPYVFTQGGEEHVFVAEAMSYAGGIPQEIDGIDEVYDWNYGDWRSEGDGAIVSVAESTTETTVVTAAGDNGNDAVLVTATISENSLNVPTAAEVIGSAPVTAFLCENPWPGSFAQLPWSDTADGDQGAEIGDETTGLPGWMNFSTMYCRDNGPTESRTSEDGNAYSVATLLPEVVVVRPPVTESCGVLKE